MICHSVDTEEYTVIEVTGTEAAEEPSVVYLDDTPMGSVLEFIAVVLILFIVMTSTLLGCLVYPFIWLSRKSRLLVRQKAPFSSAEARPKNYETLPVR
jgi:hypothetical protein